MYELNLVFQTGLQSKLSLDLVFNWHEFNDYAWQICVTIFDHLISTTLYNYLDHIFSSVLFPILNHFSKLYSSDFCSELCSIWRPLSQLLLTPNDLHLVHHQLYGHWLEFTPCASPAVWALAWIFRLLRSQELLILSSWDGLNNTNVSWD